MSTETEVLTRYDRIGNKWKESTIYKVDASSTNVHEVLDNIIEHFKLTHSNGHFTIIFNSGGIVLGELEEVRRVKSTSNSLG